MTNPANPAIVKIVKLESLYIYILFMGPLK